MACTDNTVSIMSELFARITSAENIQQAYEHVLSTFSSEGGEKTFFRPGPDGEELNAFNADLKRNLESIRARLRSGTFQFGAYQETRFLKPGGKKFRYVGQFNLRDRIVQRAIQQVVVPAYDSAFSAGLLSGRKGHGSLEGVMRVIKILNTEHGMMWAYKTDIRNYAGSMDHKIISEQLGKLFRDEPEVLSLMLSHIKQPRSGDKARDKGITQGSHLADFLYDVYLNDLDHYMENNGYAYMRYSDDIFVLGKSEAEIMMAKELIEGFLRKVNLSQSMEKTMIAAPGEQFDFLGYLIKGQTFAISEQPVADLRSWVKRSIQKKKYSALRSLPRDIALKRIIDEFQSTENLLHMLSWLSYFSRINDVSQLRSADRMIREHIGSALTQCVSSKNYRYASSKKLRKLGLHSMVALHYRLYTGRKLPRDVREKVGKLRLFSPSLRLSTRVFMRANANAPQTGIGSSASTPDYSPP